MQIPHVIRKLAQVLFFVLLVVEFKILFFTKVPKVSGAMMGLPLDIFDGPICLLALLFVNMFFLDLGWRGKYTGIYAAVLLGLPLLVIIILAITHLVGY